MDRILWILWDVCNTRYTRACCREEGRGDLTSQHAPGMAIVTLKRILKSVLTLILLTAPPVMAQTSSESDPVVLPSGLASYLEARILEANGRFREAMDAYAQAVEEAPEVVEVRLSYASFLVDVGMPGKAIAVLDDTGDLGSEGLRIRALALAQEASRDASLTGQAEAALRAAVDAEENDANLLFSLAQVLARQEKFEEAEEIVAHLRMGLATNPRLVVFHADLLRATGRSEEAAELYSQCVGGGPTARKCRDDFVDLMVEIDRPGEAGEAMLEWLSDSDLDGLMRAAGLLWEGGRLEQSLETVQRVLERAPDSVRAQTLEAHLLSSLGRHQEAVSRLQKLAKKNPKDVDLILAMAWSLSRSGQHEKGRVWLKRAWALVSDDSGSRRAIRTAVTAARMELVADHPIVAREWLDRVTDPSGVGPDFVRILAETYRRQEQWRDGVSALVRIQPSLAGRAQIEAEAIEAEFLLRMNDPRAWRRLRPLLDSNQAGRVFLGLQVLQGLERWQDVERESGLAVERFADSRDLLFIRAAALEQLDRFEESAVIFRQLVEKQPDDANAANYLGYMLADREMHLDEALELIARAVALDPENSAYLDSLGWVHFRRGDLDEAEQWLRRAVELGDNLGDGTIYCHLGEVLLAAGDQDEGRRYLLLGLDMGCDDPDHVRSLLERTDDDQP